ncbi:MAG TPA: GNAT family N-acetyltransferase [Candidatus Saccharimonadia bacterium]|nr:GNAT family N-acetyltransferase [Candidatus Saccharimonadia bacterium]
MNVAADRALRFRPATPDDVGSIVALVESAYRGEVSKQGWTTEADLLDGQRTDPAGVLALVAAADSRIVLAERDGRLLACAHLERHGRWAYFGMFAVRPDLQGGGVGNEVLVECERIARAEWGCIEMRMTVISLRAELIGWYERRGYRKTGERKPFPYGDPRFGLPRRDDLEFIVLAKPIT